jgi:SIR2-like protein
VNNTPHVWLCPRGYGADLPSKEDQEYRATKKEPLVYHLFGHFRQLDSIVLTQDDYFDYLIDVTRKNDIIPKIVGSSLTNTALLFLGFQMSDWDFRVFFRSIMSQEGSERRKRFSHVAVQIDPEQDRLVDPARARRYLETYFSDTKISIFWGSAEDFLSLLQRKMQELQ